METALAFFSSRINQSTVMFDRYVLMQEKVYTCTIAISIFRLMYVFLHISQFNRNCNKKSFIRGLLFLVAILRLRHVNLILLSSEIGTNVAHAQIFSRSVSTTRHVQQITTNVFQIVPHTATLWRSIERGVYMRILNFCDVHRVRSI